MNNISLVDLIERILQANYITVHRIRITDSLDFPVLDLGLRSEILGLENIHASLLTYFKSMEPCKIYFTTDMFQCTYASMLLPDEESLIFCGPALFEEIKGDRFEELFSTLTPPLTEEFKEPMEVYYKGIACQRSYYMFESLFLELGKALYGSECQIVYSEADLFEHWDTAWKNRLQISEHPFTNIEIIETRYESENQLMNAVASGNEALALSIVSRFQNMYLPQRMTNDLRDTKDYTITLNTLLRKGTEYAGVHPIHIDTYSNNNISVIERQTSSAQCMALQRKLIRGYCQIVREHKQKSRSPIIRKIVAYVDTDLEADLTLKALSEHLGVNASYLSTLFSKEMGMSLTDYVNNHRINFAKALLANTDLPIKSIAHRCGIGDIHYFTRLFKKITEMTPKGYREAAVNLTRENLSKAKK